MGGCISALVDLSDCSTLAKSEEAIDRSVCIVYSV